jgi:hypothetical protein
MNDASDVRDLAIPFGARFLGQLGLLAAGLMLLALQWVDAAPPLLRTALALAFLGAGPGAALVGLFRLNDLWATTSLVIAVSLATDVVVAQVMLMAGIWSPTFGLTVLVVMTALPIVLGLKKYLQEQAR